MSYKRYIKRGGKVFGPYTYSSHRVNGKVVSEYEGISKKLNLSKKLLIPVILLCFLVLIFIGIRYVPHETNLQSTSFSELRNINGVSSFVKDASDNPIIKFTSSVISAYGSAKHSIFRIIGLVSDGEGNNDNSASDNSNNEKKDAEKAEEKQDKSEDKKSDTEIPAENIEIQTPTEIPQIETPEVEVPQETPSEEPITSTETPTETQTQKGNSDNENNEGGNNNEKDKNKTNEEVSNIPETNQTIPEINITIPEVNNSIEQNITIPEQNITINNETISEINQTELNITETNITQANITQINITNVNNKTLIQFKSVIGRPVKWVMKLSANELTKIELPKESQNISIKTGDEVSQALAQVNEYESIVNSVDKTQIVSGVITGYVSADINENSGIFIRLLNWIKGFTLTGNAISELETATGITETETNKIIDMNNLISGEQEIAVEYYTDAPQATETEISSGKQVVVSGNDELNYTDILAYTLINEKYGIIQDNLDLVKIYWKENSSYINFNSYDLDNNGIYDYVEWIVPHLSNQTFEIIIEISNAQHLDENRTFVEDVYDKVKARDDNYTTINNNEYLRVTFAKNLTNKNDITIYARGLNNNSVDVEVYEKDSNVSIAKFENINDYERKKILLTNLSECYDNETEILTENGWKYFFELNNLDKVATLNNKTGKIGWQTPTEKQIYEHNGDMYNIELEDGSDLLVSPEHKVYSNILRKDKSLETDNQKLISIIMMTEFGKNDRVFNNLEHKDKTSDMNSFVVLQVTPQVFEMLNGSFVKISDLTYLFLNSSEQRNIFTFEFIENIFNKSDINIHELHQALNSFKVFGLSLPDFNSLETFSTEPTTSLTIDSLTSLKSFSEISDISRIFFNSSKVLTSFNASTKAVLAIDDQLIKSVSSILHFNSFGTDNVIVPIFDIQSKYLYYVQTKDIFKPFGLNYSLNKIKDVYLDINSGNDIYFLNSENEPVKVKSITKENYHGKIYDVDVPNDIVLVKRDNKTALWSGNSNSHTQDTFDLLSIGDVEYDYIVDPAEDLYFVSQWDTRFTSTGSSNASNLTLPLESAGIYDFTVNWGDGSPNDTITAWNDVKKQHRYGLGGAYNITINGTINGFRFANTGDRLKLVNISQWGNLRLGNANGYFYGASNLNITATDTLDLTGTTTMLSAFRSCKNLTLIPSANSWDISSVTSMVSMFSASITFNQNLSNWDTKSTTTMSGMFNGATNFNQSIGNWNTSKVTTMSNMFQSATNFDQNISSWDTSKVITFGAMFLSASNFNQDLNGWNTSTATTMSNTFQNALKFNGNISNWDTSSVTNMGFMFNNANDFNQSIGNWNTSNVNTMASMFVSCTNFDQNLSNWDTHNVTLMSSMFSSASNFNQDISNWDTSKVGNMADMFSSASNFNQPLGNWNVSNVTTMNNMFKLVNLSTNNYDNILNGWASLPSLNYTILAGFGNSTYSCNSVTARNTTLIGVWGWKINDGGYNSSVVCGGDAEYPIFSNYWEDNGSLIDSGVGHFNVTLLSTNTSVYLEINNTNYSATQSGNVYNVSVDFSKGGTYLFQWISWGNGTSHLYNVSGERSYSVNVPISDIEYPIFSNPINTIPNGSQYSPNKKYEFNISILSTNGSVGLQFNGINYTATNFTNNRFNVTLQNLGVGNYTYQWNAFGNGTSHLYNVTRIYDYAIVQNTSTNISLYLNNTQANITIEQASIINLNCSLIRGDASEKLLLFNNRTLINNKTSPLYNATNFTNYALMNVTCIYEATQNYSWTSENWWVNISDTTIPSVSLINPPNLTITANTTINFTANITDTGSGVKNATLFIYNETGLYNETTVSFEAGVFSTIIGIPVLLVQGVYTWFYQAFDWVGNLGTSDSSTGNFTVTVDTTLPVITILYPQNTTYGFLITALNYTYNETNVDSCWWTNNSGTWNSTKVAARTNFTGITSDLGANTWRVYCNDSANNVNNVSVTFVSGGPSFYFISTWDTRFISTGSSNASRVVLPLEAIGTYDFTVRWGDGSQDTITNGSSEARNHSYASSDAYNITINGTINGFRFNNGGDKFKIVNISQWGSLRLGNTGSYFLGASNLNITATDVLNLTGTTTFISAFQTCRNITLIPSANSWDISEITSMASTFATATSFNQNLSNWNTSQVITMANMFNLNSRYNQSMEKWDTHNVISMNQMFVSAISFNGNISTWNTSQVTNMVSMFNSASSLNQSLENWDTHNVTSINTMFASANRYNGNMSSWDVSKATSFLNMFAGATSFDQDISNWNTSRITTMSSMFNGASKFNQNISNWNTSNVNIFDSMFSSATLFNGNISGWDTHNATSMQSVFNSASNFNQSLANWNTSKVTTMATMFQSAVIFDGNISNWDTSKVTRMNGMFNGANKFNQPIGNWNTSQVTTMANMLTSTTNFNQDLSNWDTHNVTSMSGMFNTASNFNQDISNWDTSKVGNMADMFSSASNFNQPLGTWNVSSVQSMQNMFLLVNLSTDNYDNILNGWASLPSLNYTILAGFGNSTYSCNSVTARNTTLIGVWGWKINDGGLNNTVVCGGDAERPIFSSFNESLANGSQYTTGIKYYFNITILSTNTSVQLEFNGINYTATNFTNNRFNVTLQNLGVGNYTYQWNAFGNGTSHLYNVTRIYDYAIVENMSELKLYIDGIEDDKIVNYSTLTNVICITSSVQGDISLIRNGTNITTGTPSVNDTKVLDIWVYNYTCVYNSTQNYTSAIKSFLLNVTDGVSPIVSLIYPLNNTINYTSNTINFFYNVTDYSDIQNCSLLINRGIDTNINLTETSVAKNTTNNLSVYLNDGDYNWSVECFDAYGNRGQNETRNFSIGVERAISISLSEQLNLPINWNVTSLPSFNLSADGNNLEGVTTLSISVSTLGLNADVYVKANGDLANFGGDVLGLGNETLSFNITNNLVPSVTKLMLTPNYDIKIGDNLAEGSVIFLKFFLSAPVSQATGSYNNSLTFKAVQTGTAP